MYPGHWAKIFPAKDAAINTATGAASTYAQLNDRSNQLAQLMWDHGLRKGDHLAILMENHLAYFDVAWAALRSGLYLTTINRYLTTDEAAYILANCEAKVLVASRQLADVAAPLTGVESRCKTWLTCRYVRSKSRAAPSMVAASFSGRPRQRQKPTSWRPDRRQRSTWSSLR